MRRLCSLIALLAAAGCTTTSSTGSDSKVSTTVPGPDGDLEVERVTPWLRVESQKDIGTEVKLDVASRVRRAFEYALEMHGWNDPGAICEEALVVKVTKAAKGEGTAIIKGPELFVIAVGPSGVAALDGALAQEVAQVQDLRVLKKNSRAFPRYLHEGKAISMGLRYAQQLGEKREDDVERARLITQLKADELRRLFRDDDWRELRGPIRLRFIAASALFYEFLALHYTPRGEKTPVRLARVLELTAQTGNYDAAFKTVFGRTPLAVEAEFETFIEKTEGRPDERLRGTPYEGLAGS